MTNSIEFQLISIINDVKPGSVNSSALASYWGRLNGNIHRQLLINQMILKNSRLKFYFMDFPVIFKLL